MPRCSRPDFFVPADAVDCHVHIFDPARFPYAADRRYTPGPATVAALRHMHEIIGISRVVVVQPSVYGCDNRCLLDALRQLGARARGVAVVDDDIGRTELEDLVAAGVRGIRLNLQQAGVTQREDARRAVCRALDRIAGMPLLLQVYAPLTVLLACADLLLTTHNDVLIDHYALAPTDLASGAGELHQLQALLAQPHMHIKLSGPHQISRVEPDHGDVAELAALLASAAPGRAVWGSDWPHTGGRHRLPGSSPLAVEAFRQVDDGHELSLLQRWLAESRPSLEVLVEAPAALFDFAVDGSVTIASLTS